MKIKITEGKNRKNPWKWNCVGNGKCRERTRKYLDTQFCAFYASEWQSARGCWSCCEVVVENMKIGMKCCWFYSWILEQIIENISTKKCSTHTSTQHKFFYQWNCVSLDFPMLNQKIIFFRLSLARVRLLFRNHTFLTSKNFTYIFLLSSCLFDFFLECFGQQKNNFQSFALFIPSRVIQSNGCCFSKLLAHIE